MVLLLRMAAAALMGAAVIGAVWPAVDLARSDGVRFAAHALLTTIALTLFTSLMGAASVAIVLVALATLIAKLDMTRKPALMLNAEAAPGRHRPVVTSPRLKVAAAFLFLAWMATPALPHLYLAAVSSDMDGLYVIVGDGTWGEVIRLGAVGATTALVLVALAAVLTRVDTIRVIAERSSE